MRNSSGFLSEIKFSLVLVLVWHQPPVMMSVNNSTIFIIHITFSLSLPSVSLFKNRKYFKQKYFKLFVIVLSSQFPWRQWRQWRYLINKHKIPRICSLLLPCLPPALLSFERALQTRLDKLGPQPPLVLRCDEDELNMRIFLLQGWLSLKQQTEPGLLSTPSRLHPASLSLVLSGLR